jgi:flagellum-specific peptidoglycan hydrolase FlgJ
MKMKRSITFCLASFLLISLTRTPIALANSGSQLKNQINQIEKERQTTLNDLQNKKAALNANKKQQSNIVNQVQELESQIESSNYEIQVKQDSIQATQQNIETLKNNVSMLQKRINQRKNLIEDRARSVYVNGGSSTYLQLMVDATNFYDFVNRVVFVNKIAQQDHSILKQQVTDKQKLEKYQQALQITLNQLNSDLHNLNQMKASLDSKKVKEKTLLKRLQKKALKIKLAVTSQEQQAGLFQQQEEAHKKDLSQWEAEQKRTAPQVQANSYSNPSGIPQDVQPFIKPAQELENSTGIPASITLAQITLESDAGGQLSELATAGKNLFGIKGQGPDGTIILTTHEVIGGMDLTIDAGFKRYQTYYQSMVDHAQILKLSRYQYFLKNAHSLKEFAYGIQDGGYSTDPYYAMKLLTVIQEYGLNRYDTGSF